MKKITLLAAISFCIFFTKLHAQVGIGTPTPNAASVLHVDAGSSITKGLLITGTFNNLSATVPDLGAGSRLMFYPGKAAFRVGYVNGNQWDNSLVGPYSVAMGNNTTASGNQSTAMGFTTTASGNYSTAMGHLSTASGGVSTAIGQSNAIGNFSTAIGNNTYANGDYSTAIGNSTQANGNSSTAMGFNTYAIGGYSTAMGYGTTADGDYSTAMGYLTHASGNYSTAMGYSTTASGGTSTAMGYNASTNSHAQSFCIGGGTNTNNIFPMVANNADNQMMMYFDNYIFYSGTGGQGVALTQNSNSWTTICDKNKKENFEPLDGEDVLNKISKIGFTSWNYKGLDPKKYRHYGIMAQDFYGAFGKDKYGVIGNDTTVNPIDMIGIDMAAIQALEKRTEKIELLENKNKKIESENAALLTSMEEMAAEIKKLQQTVEAIAIEQKAKDAAIAKK